MTDRSIGVEGETGGEAKGSGTGRHGIVGDMLCVEGRVTGRDWGGGEKAWRWWLPLGQEQRRPGFQVMKSGLV